MSTPTRALDVLVLDMSTIRFQWNADHTACVALTCRGEILAVVGVAEADPDPRQVAWQLLDAALDQGQVLRAHPADPARRVNYRVALYNPFSAEVSIAAVPQTVTFTDHDPVALAADGEVAVAVTSGRNPHVRFEDGRTLSPRQLTFAGLTRVQVAHQAA